MDTPKSSSEAPSRTSTPQPYSNPRFTSQGSTAEDLLKSQTVGLVHLSDYRKRRAEALEQKEREAQDRTLGTSAALNRSGTSTPLSDGASSLGPRKKKQKKKAPLAGKLSFGLENEEDGESSTETSSVRDVSKDRLKTGLSSAASRQDSPRKESSVENQKPAQVDTARSSRSPAPTSAGNSSPGPRRLGPNTSVANFPRILTKSAKIREAQERESLRKEFMAMQAAVKETEILMPFVFYDGTNLPGGVCKIKKGEHVWLFLDKARKVGAQRGSKGSNDRGLSRREWARVSVDDLILVKGEIIIPHHYELYYFMINKILGTDGKPLLNFSSQPTEMTPSIRPEEEEQGQEEEQDAVVTYATGKAKYREKEAEAVEAEKLDDRYEGHDHDPTLTKVVDRRWYERNKHIFPASVWQEYEPDKDFSKAIRRDAGGNAFFFA